jgi:E3 ubiquitin-protein ligase BRE1
MLNARAIIVIFTLHLAYIYLVSVDPSSFPSELFFADNERFEGHLKSHSKDIKSTISQLFKNLTKPPPDVRDLQARILKLLASEKAHITELDRVRAEKEQLDRRLEGASLRYMLAEKKLDRAKSQSVAKLERQAIFAGCNEAGGESSNKTEASGAVNGVAGHGDGSADADVGRREAIAVTVRQKEQLEKLESENEKLTGLISTMTVRVCHSAHCFLRARPPSGCALTIDIVISPVRRGCCPERSFQTSEVTT